MKQLSDCCKAEIKLTGSPEHKDAFACAKCGRIIGTSIYKSKQIGEEKMCKNTTSGKHKWIEQFDGFKESYLTENNTVVGVPKTIIKCQACGLYKF